MTVHKAAVAPVDSPHSRCSISLETEQIQLALWTISEQGANPVLKHYRSPFSGDVMRLGPPLVHENTAVLQKSKDLPPAGTKPPLASLVNGSFVGSKQVGDRMFPSKLLFDSTSTEFAHLFSFLRPVEQPKDLVS